MNNREIDELKYVYKKLFGEKLKDVIRVVSNKCTRTFVNEMLKVVLLVDIKHTVPFRRFHVFI